MDATLVVCLWKKMKLNSKIPTKTLILWLPLLVDSMIWPNTNWLTSQRCFYFLFRQNSSWSMNVTRCFPTQRCEEIFKTSSSKLPTTNRSWCSAQLCQRKWRKVDMFECRLQKVFAERSWNFYWWRKINLAWIGSVLCLYQWGTSSMR